MNPSNFLETLETFEFLVFGKWPVEGYGRLVGESFKNPERWRLRFGTGFAFGQDVGRRFDPAPSMLYWSRVVLQLWSWAWEIRPPLAAVDVVLTHVWKASRKLGQMPGHEGYIDSFSGPLLNICIYPESTQADKSIAYKLPVHTWYKFDTMESGCLCIFALKILCNATETPSRAIPSFCHYRISPCPVWSNQIQVISQKYSKAWLFGPIMYLSVGVV
jgi:hypothetical protein